MPKFLKRIRDAFVVTAVLTLIVAVLNVFAEGWGSTAQKLSTVWWMPLLLAAIIATLYLIADLKQAVHDKTADVTGGILERGAARKDRESGESKAKQAESLKTAKYSREEASRIRSRLPDTWTAVIDKVERSGSLQVLLIPMYLYEKGLPGDHMYRRVLGGVYSVAHIEAGSIVFNECKPATYDNGKGIGLEIARIPVGAVHAIAVVDNEPNRKTMRVVAAAVDRTLGSFSKAIHGGKMESSVVRGATLYIRYVSVDGVLCDAQFEVPSGTKAGKTTKTAIQKTLEVRGNIQSWDGTFKTLGGASFIEGLSILSWADAIVEKVEMVSTIMEMLSSEESAVPTARVTAEMLATFTQNQGFQLSFIVEADASISSSPGAYDTP